MLIKLLSEFVSRRISAINHVASLSRRHSSKNSESYHKKINPLIILDQVIIEHEKLEEKKNADNSLFVCFLAWSHWHEENSILHEENDFLEFLFLLECPFKNFDYDGKWKPSIHRFDVTLWRGFNLLAITQRTLQTLVTRWVIVSHLWFQVRDVIKIGTWRRFRSSNWHLERQLKNRIVFKPKISRYLAQKTKMGQ